MFSHHGSRNKNFMSDTIRKVNQIQTKRHSLLGSQKETMFAFPRRGPFRTSSAILKGDLEKLRVNPPKSLPPSKGLKTTAGETGRGGALVETGKRGEELA